MIQCFYQIYGPYANYTNHPHNIIYSDYFVIQDQIHGQPLYSIMMSISTLAC